MKTKIIRWIEESGITDEIEMILRDNEIVLRSAETTRKNWEASFEKMAEQDDDTLLDQQEIEEPSEWDEAEWTW